MTSIAPLDLGAHCIHACWLDSVPFFAMADGTVHRLDHGHKTAEVHDGLLSATSDGTRLLSGGEDGRVVSTAADGEGTEIASIGRKWISAVATGPQQSLAFANGKTVRVVLPDGSTRVFEHTRTAEGIAFAPKGLRIAVARYNGATLHFPATAGKPSDFEWAGAHTAVTFSPDANFLVTTMQENALHGWKLADGKHMRMTGYPTKVKDWSWSARGRWLATSGASAAIVWPFHHKDGPMGKAPLELGTRGSALVTAVACHPRDEIAAIGYNDGMILAVRFSDAKEVVLRRGGSSPLTSMAWDRDGARLVFGSEGGDCGVLDVSA